MLFHSGFISKDTIDVKGMRYLRLKNKYCDRKSDGLGNAESERKNNVGRAGDR